MKENVVKQKSFAFALRAGKLAQYLQGEKKQLVLSKQVLGAQGTEEKNQGKLQEKA